MKSDQSLTIVMPAYNEEARIGRTLEAYLAHFHSDRFPQTEILVVANGCRDNTAQVVQEFAASHPNLRLIIEPRPIGKGGALMVGFREARGDLIGFVDADNSTEPPSFQHLVESLDDGDVVIGSRWIKGAVVEPRQPLARRITSRVFNSVVRLFFGVKVTDTQCGAKVFRAEVIEKVLPNLGITRWAFDVDLLFQCQRFGYRIRELPTVWSDSSGSKLHLGRTSWEMLLAIIRLRLVYSPFRWVVTIYDTVLGRWTHRE